MAGALSGHFAAEAASSEVLAGAVPPQAGPARDDRMPGMPGARRAADGAISMASDDDFEATGDSHIRPVEKLSDRDQQILTFEKKWWRHAGSKEQAIRERFELSATRYYQVLNKLLDLPEALEFDPVTVGRLRRLRATRVRSRGSR